MLGLAHRLKAKLLFVSSGAAVYGDPPPDAANNKGKSKSSMTGTYYDSAQMLTLPSPAGTQSTKYTSPATIYQAKETYWGHVKSNSYLAAFAESVRSAETMVYAYKNRNDVDVRVARVFHTYGPRMSMFQRRVQTGVIKNTTTNYIHSHLGGVSADDLGVVGPLLDDGSFMGSCIAKALLHEKIIVPGDGLALRTMTYVDDTVSALIELMNSKHEKVVSGPVNIGSVKPASLLDIAHYIVFFTNSSSKITTEEAVLKRHSPGVPKSVGNIRNRYHQGSSQHTSVVVPDLSLAKEALGWRSQMPLALGMHLTVEHIKKELRDSGLLM